MSSRTCNNFLAMTWRQANGHSTVISPNKRYTSLSIVSNGNATAMQRNATQRRRREWEGCALCVPRPFGRLGGIPRHARQHRIGR